MILGGCDCGFVRYAISAPPTGLTVCHCARCQRQSGSAFGMTLAVPDGAFALTSGHLKSFQMVCDSGRTKTCAFCPDCGSRITHSTVNGLGVKAGTLDDTAALAPGAHYWTSRKQAWVAIPPDAPCSPDDSDPPGA